jgi:hypothetical protein
MVKFASGSTGLGNSIGDFFRVEFYKASVSLSNFCVHMPPFRLYYTKFIFLPNDTQYIGVLMNNTTTYSHAQAKCLFSEIFFKDILDF